MTTEAVLNAVIDANILLLVACLVWTAASALFSVFGVKNSFQEELRAQACSCKREISPWMTRMG